MSVEQNASDAANKAHMTQDEKDSLWGAIESAYVDTTTFSREAEDAIERTVERIIAARVGCDDCQADLAVSGRVDPFAHVAAPQIRPQRTTNAEYLGRAWYVDDHVQVMFFDTEAEAQEYADYINAADRARVDTEPG